MIINANIKVTSSRIEKDAEFQFLYAHPDEIWVSNLYSTKNPFDKWIRFCNKSQQKVPIDFLDNRRNMDKDKI